jgi:hypothetical protein
MRQPRSERLSAGHRNAPRSPARSTETGYSPV